MEVFGFVKLASRRIGFTRLDISETSMNASSNSVTKSYFEPLIAGDRNACRKVIEQAIDVGIAPYDLLNQLIWPTMELLQGLYRDDRITISQLNLATRLNRSLTDQICARLPRAEEKG